MKFLVDAQLPRRLATWLVEQGDDSIHTLDLPAGNATTDAEVIDRAVSERRIVISKDADFVESFLVSGRPPYLWLISTGNISNQTLESLIRVNFQAVCRAFTTARFVELGRDVLTVRG